MADQISELTIPQPNPYNRQAVKEYIFNETGNIMLASTALGSKKISRQVRDVFAEVAVFFAAMTKAISTTIDPATNQSYSIYDYDVLQGIVDGSGLFVQVTEEDLHHSSQSFGAELSKELVEGLLGLATGAGELSFAEGMIAAMGQEGLKISGSSASTSSKVATIVFVCEYLLGMPIVSALVVSVDAKQYKQQFQAGPCLKESSTTFDMVMHKDTYMFVTPRFIKQYSGDLASVEDDVDFAEFVSYLSDLVVRRPVITGVNTTRGGLAPGVLVPGEEYVIVGAFLDNSPQAPAKGRASSSASFRQRDRRGRRRRT
ncbi:hypothetical protein GCM10025864_25650 [Luteimicrobium album]|uniref:Uncharacterized protein n=2 Tax=Luteimicrobium album TaxID=1054550 RepID=A0ABQ6I234_9MICO|nr:hypothetical protein GCM10025864_25650 [Luteimicrobium album]